MPDVHDQTKESPHKQRQSTEYFDNHRDSERETKSFQETRKIFTFRHDSPVIRTLDALTFIISVIRSFILLLRYDCRRRKNNESF